MAGDQHVQVAAGTGDDAVILNPENAPGQTIWKEEAAVRGQMWATTPVPPRIYHSIGALELDALYT
jgi:hypothetical protein